MKIRYFVLSVAVIIAAAAISAQAADNAPGQAVKPAELIALLKSNAPPSEKAKAFKPLAVFGGKDAVEAIAPYLADEQLTSWARIALEAIPDPAADEALRKAQAELKGRVLIGVINSIGVRRDAQAVDALAKRLGDDELDVAVAAAASLGRIGGDAATEALEKALPNAAPALRSELADGLVRCAEKCLAGGNKDAAVRLFDLVSKADVPENRVLEGVRGGIVARGNDGLPLLIALLKSPQKKRFNLGLKLTREIAAPEVTDALLAELAGASAVRQQLLLLALADRADPKARAALVNAAKTATGEARIASIRGLRGGDASCGPVLLDAAVDASEAVSAAAVETLVDLPAKEIDEMVAKRLESASGAGRLALVEVAGRRHIAAATATLLKLADDADGKVRSAALTALGATIPASDLSILIARAVATDKPADAKAAEAALRSACTRISERDVAATQILDAMAKGETPAKCTLLKMLVVVGGEKALKAAAAAAEDSNAEVRRAGYKALGEWTSVDAGPALVRLVKTGDPELKVGALRGYIRVARQFVIPNEPRMEMFREIMALAQRDEERQLALDILKQIRTPESLAVAVGYLDKPALCDRGASVAVTLSNKMVATNPTEVSAAMKAVIQKAKNKDSLDKARGLLNRAEKK